MVSRWPNGWSKATGEVAGAARRLPLSGWLFLWDFLAATGSPPFAPFRSIFVGIYLPAPLNDLLGEVARFVRASP